MSRKFTDSENREWTIVLSTISVKRVNAECGVLLTAVADDDWALLRQLYEDAALTVDVLWCLVRRQAKRLGVTDDEETQATEKFAEALGGDVLYRATEALAGSVSDFFPNPAQREAMAKVLETVGKVIELTTADALEKIRAVDADSLARSCTAAALSSPELPESHPGTIPLAS